MRRVARERAGPESLPLVNLRTLGSNDIESLSLAGLLRRQAERHRCALAGVPLTLAIDDDLMRVRCVWQVILAVSVAGSCERARGAPSAAVSTGRARRFSTAAGRPAASSSSSSYVRRGREREDEHEVGEVRATETGGVQRQVREK